MPDLPRRQFVQGLAAGGLLMGLGPMIKPAWAQRVETSMGAAAVLEGTEFDLTVAETPVNFTGSPRMATTINGSIPGPTLRWREGDTVTIRVTNRLAVDTSIHWHGILLPFQMDGVPGVSFKGIPPGETFTYRFKVGQTGTYWYHSHSALQEQTGMYGAIIIDSASSRSTQADRDYVVQLSDWTDEDPMRVLTKLKIQSDYYNYNQPTAVDFFKDVSRDGLKSALSKRKMWNEMRMSPTDLADISAATYTYLMNGSTPAANWTGIFKPGEKVRLRLINSGTMTFFDVRIPGLKMTVVQSDGQDIEPVTVDEIRIGVAETYDVIVTPGDDTYTIFAQSMDRTGFARGTLATREGLSAAVPELEKAEWLTMGDMMGAMGGGMAGMNHGGMAGGGMAMDHSQHTLPGMVMGNSLSKPSTTARHAKTEYGASTDMRVDMARTNLDDPGHGLRDNGRRVLTYADVHTIGGPIDARGPGREVELHLTGNMERYTWSLDGLEFGQSTPVHFKHGERVRVILHNDTMMAHPMHLHGMWSELESDGGGFQARKHTIIVQPAQRISFLVSADALGRWAWHCHLLLHMDAGMFREVVVS
ncbi:MAG: copper resistance system multicopper oxidase [Sulfuriferula multivorans]|uniref:Copper resistance system multicopper oxidase n=1 Tax=Sulfuriferula multivorans TaxID=1559896 RepID=A0A7C9K1Q4_9PROT|nr:copper resistance system multicopper oxidase [Sulfuriferula multivorans]